MMNRKKLRLGETFIVDTEYLDEIHENGMAYNCFGDYRKVTRIVCDRDDIHGRRFVIYYTEYGRNASMSCSAKEGEKFYWVGMNSSTGE